MIADVGIPAILSVGFPVSQAGKLGSVYYELRTGNGGTRMPRTNADVIEYGNGSYGIERTFTVEESLLINWDIDGTNYTASESITVSSAGLTSSQDQTLTDIKGDTTNILADVDALPAAEETADAVWDEPLDDHLTAGSAGSVLKMVELIRAVEAGEWKIENNQMIFYDTAGAEVLRFDLFNSFGTPAMDNVFRRVPV